MYLISKKKYLIQIWSAIFIIGNIFISCQKEETIPSEQIENLGGFSSVSNPEIDQWIYDSLTVPYNVTVKYKYDPFETDYFKNTVPADEKIVIPTMAMVVECMTRPYLAVKDSAMVRKIIPKLWVLLGSGEYNDNGTVVLGQAEGGNKITLMDINKFDRHDTAFVIKELHTVHHETSHILHQTIMYPTAFKFINPELYTATWFNNSGDDANSLGFVTNYAMAASDEDFVETIAYLLVEGQKSFDNLVTKASDIGKQRLLSKETIVVSYFKDV